MSGRTPVITVVIRDESAARWFGEPLSYRTVQVELTPQQVAAISFLHKDEAISQCFFDIEPERAEDTHER